MNENAVVVNAPSVIVHCSVEMGSDLEGSAHVKSHEMVVKSFRFSIGELRSWPMMMQKSRRHFLFVPLSSPVMIRSRMVMCTCVGGVRRLLML